MTSLDCGEHQPRLIYTSTLAASCAANNCPSVYKKIRQKFSCTHITLLSWCSILKHLSILSLKYCYQKQKYNYLIFTNQLYTANKVKNLFGVFEILTYLCRLELKQLPQSHRNRVPECECICPALGLFFPFIWLS